MSVWSFSFGLVGKKNLLTWWVTLKQSAVDVQLLGSLSNYDDDHNDDFKKNSRFNDQNNSSARASCFLVHFFDVHCTTRTWNLLIWRFMEDLDIRRQIFLHLFNLNKILKNLTPGNVACTWHIERVQIDAVKYERTQIHFFADVFTSVVVVLA